MAKDSAAIDFSMADFDAIDEAEMAVVVNGKVTDWLWRFAGPGHPQTIEYQNRMARDSMHQERKLEEQRRNGKKVKLPDESVDEVRLRNIEWIVTRLLGWSPVRIDGEDYPFSPENARKLLLDQRKEFLRQAIDFLTADDSFTRRSAKS